MTAFIFYVVKCTLYGFLVCKHSKRLSSLLLTQLDLSCMKSQSLYTLCWKSEFNFLLLLSGFKKCILLSLFVHIFTYLSDFKFFELIDFKFVLPFFSVFKKRWSSNCCKEWEKLCEILYTVFPRIVSSLE